jgi:hypothetical protein
MPDGEGGDHRLPPHWRDAARWFTKRLDDDMRRRYRGGKLPWERSVEVGQIDWWRIHSYALDRLDELLAVVLPHGELVDGDTAWRARHDEYSPWIVVQLLSGAWSEPATGKRGADLVGLVARIYGMSHRRAAIFLAQQLGIEAVRRG